MQSWWRSSGQVRGGTRMDLIRRIERLTDELEGRATGYVRAADLEEEAGGSLAERIEQIEAQRDAAAESTGGAVEAMQQAESLLSSETARGEAFRQRSLAAAAAPTDGFDAAPVLKELGYARAADAARARRERKDGIEKLVRPGTTRSSFDARWGTGLRGCATAKAPPAQPVATRLGRERAATLSPGWQMPQEGRGASLETLAALEGHRRAIAALRTDPVDPKDSQAAAALAARHPGRAQPHPLFQPVPVTGTDPESATQCLRERGGGVVDTAECDPADPGQLWGRLGGRDLVGYRHGTLLEELRTDAVGPRLRDAAGAEWPVGAPSLDPVFQPRVAFEWAAGRDPQDGTVVLRSGGRRLVFAGTVPDGAELCLGVLAAPCTLRVRFSGALVSVAATPTDDPRVWQGDDGQAVWRAEGTPEPAAGARSLEVAAPGEGRAAVLRVDGRVRGRLEAPPEGLLQWTLAGRGLRVTSVVGLVGTD